jgi:hypothetical protein
MGKYSSKKKKAIDFSKVTIYDKLPGFKIDNGKVDPGVNTPITCKVKNSQKGTKLKNK